MIVPIEEDHDDPSINELSVWQSLKSWTTKPSEQQRAAAKKRNDSDSINTRTSSYSISKLKNMFLFKNYSDSNKRSSSISTANSIDDNTTLEDEEEAIAEGKPRNSSINGILINCHDKERKKKRNQHIIKLQKQNSKLTYHPCFKEKQQHHLPIELEASSSDTLLSPDEPVKKKKSVAFSQPEEDLYNPRIMFIETSPVPRFRNVAPPPPPSPPYLDIIIHQDTDVHSIIKSPMTDEDEPTVFTHHHHTTTPSTFYQPTNDIIMDDHDRNISLLYESLRPRPPTKPKLYFYSPLQRGQTIKFSLKNMIPEDHIILFKFLTTNNNTKGQPERYFVRPSAGKMTTLDQTEIMLFLNQVPSGPAPKDKIIVRWAAIQRHTVIEDWIHSLQESTRRKWLDMLEEQWPNQVTIRMTRIKIRFQ